ncbi:adenine phosphoribosyltransferase [Halovenus sp. WSH3]|uniref:Adenine phosphoribosyltransferase n=1 Tax=Halovenus carboxidivorans TaxID=2692199 RepID=A0A6B0T158_9EURY|nr:hypoxanthine/guanine phosphoribosyltransferase [Halovenus carboxidivorans]MXR51938.1 adenine phosphoribosyltransferase [Halovenus carboxidivorans]
MDRLLDSLHTAPIIDKDGYEYLVHPITNGVPMLDPALLREVVVEMIRRIDTGVDKIVVPEAMGIHLGAAVSLQTDVPLVVIRKRPYGLEGERRLFKETGYSDSEMYVNDVDEDDRIVILDDILSTGGTLAAICETLDEIGCEIVDIVVVMRKVGGESAFEDIEYEATSLVDISVSDGEVTIHRSVADESE